MKKIIFICSALFCFSFLLIGFSNTASARKVYPKVSTSKGLAPDLYLPDNPTPAVIKINEAKQAWFEDRFQDACDLWREALNLSPRHPEGIWHDIGLCSMKLHAYEDAIQAYTNAIRLFPREEAFNYRGRGEAYLKIGDTYNADKDFQKAKDIEQGRISSTKPKKTTQPPKDIRKIAFNNKHNASAANSASNKSSADLDSEIAFNKINQIYSTVVNYFHNWTNIKTLRSLMLLFFFIIAIFIFFFNKENMIKLAEKGNLDKIKKELASGYSVNQRHGKFGVTLLMIAAQYGHLDLVQYLLSRGAIVDMQDAVSKETTLFYAVEQDDPEIVEILLDRGANINAKNCDGLTPLMKAIFCDQEENVRLLIKRGADLELKDSDGATAYDHAMATGNEHLTKLLLKLGTTKKRLK